MTIVPSNPRRIRSFSPQNAAIPPLEMRDSIRSKVLGRGGVDLGGEEKPFCRKVSPPLPIFLSPPCPLLLQLQTLRHTLRQGAVQREKGPPPAGSIEHVPACTDGTEDVTGDELGRGYDAGRKTPPGDHSGGNVPRFDRQDANPGIPKPRPQAGKKRRETRLRRTVGVVRSPSAIPRHRAQPDEQAGTARFESLRRLQKHGNQPSEITFYYLECRLGVPARAILIPEQPHSAQHRIRAGRQKPPQGGTRSRIERVERKDRRPTAVIRNFLKTLDIPSGKLQCPTGTRKRPGCSPGYARGRPQHEHRRHMASHINDYSILKIIRFGRWIDNFSLSIQSDLSVCI